MKRKVICFDIGTKELEKHYPGKNPRSAYALVGAFIENRGFKHRQKSVYVSIKPMSHAKANLITEELHNKYPWLSKCLQQYSRKLQEMKLTEKNRQVLL